MCGIAGIVEEGTQVPQLLQKVRLLAGHLQHRGPDSAGEWSENGVAFAHRRLAILDPSPLGNQPMVSRDGRWAVVYNGELYNHLELRRQLAGTWTSGSDAETLVRALETEGIDAVHRFVGMFSFAAWDRLNRKLYLVRDRIGIKPLYYFAYESGLQFASEPAALAATNVGCRQLNESAFPSYLILGYPPPDRTLFHGVKAVLAGEIVEYSSAGLRTRRYWRLPETCEMGRSETEWQEEFSSLWEQVTREHLLSDVPVAIFLSGGMDSSAVSAAVATYTSQPKVFIARFAERRFDESTAAVRFCQSIGLTPTILNVEFTEVEKLLPQLARHSDLPVCDSSMLGTWLLCRAASKDVKVVLSGDGADEVFSGYPTYRATELLESPVGSLARLVSAALWRWIPAPTQSSAPISFGQKATRFLRYARHGTLHAHLRWRTLIDPIALRELISGHEDPWCPWESLLEAYPRQPILNRVLAADVEGYLVQNELTRVDRMGMAHSLELRVPFLDHRVVELGFRMPYEFKGGGSSGKRPIALWLHHRGFGEVVERPKQGFNHPIASWFLDGLSERVLDKLASSRFAKLFQRRVVESWVKCHQARYEDRAYELWNILFLLEWADAHNVRL